MKHKQIFVALTYYCHGFTYIFENSGNIILLIKDDKNYSYDWYKENYI